jgi:ribosome-associated translation inhibitor RaiA
MTVADLVQITLRGISHSAALEARIRAKVRRLTQLFPSLIGCRVIAEVPHQRHSHGNQFIVRLDITMPGSEIVVNRDHHEDVYVALREAFRAARRQLNGRNGRQRATGGESPSGGTPAAMEPSVAEN